MQIIRTASLMLMLVSICLGSMGCPNREKIRQGLDDADRIAAVGEVVASLTGDKETAEKIKEARGDLREVREIVRGVEKAAGRIDGVDADPVTIIRAEKGDTLSGLAEEYYRDWRMWPLLCAATNLVDCDCLRVGEKIRVPITLKWNSTRKNREVPIIIRKAYNEPPYKSTLCTPDRLTP